MNKKPVITKKPWGSEILFALTKKYAGKIIEIDKGHRLSLQYHRKKDETFFLVKGTLRVRIGSQGERLRTMTVKAGRSFNVPPGTVHRTEAVTACTLVEVSTPELTDIVRLEDDYRRIPAKE